MSKPEFACDTTLKIWQPGNLISVGVVPSEKNRPTLLDPSPDCPLMSKVEDTPLTENVGMVSKVLPTIGLHAKL